MKKQSRLGLILLGLAIIGWFAVARGQIAVFSERSLQAKVLSEEVDSYEKRIEDVGVIKEQGEAVQSTLKAMFLAMPKTSQIPEALVMIESLAGSAGVVLSTATVGTPVDSELPVTIAFGGDINAVTKFLDAINNNVRTARVKNQTISSDGNGNLTVSLQLGFVYQGGTR